MNTKAGYENQSLMKLNGRGLEGLYCCCSYPWPPGRGRGDQLHGGQPAGGPGRRRCGTFACDGTISLGSTITNETDTRLDGTGRQVTISGKNAVRVFQVNTNVTFTLANLTIADGYSRGGSAILNLGGTVNLAGITFLWNTAPIHVKTMP